MAAQSHCAERFSATPCNCKAAGSAMQGLELETSSCKATSARSRTEGAKWSLSLPMPSGDLSTMATGREPPNAGCGSTDRDGAREEATNRDDPDSPGSPASGGGPANMNSSTFSFTFGGSSSSSSARSTSCNSDDSSHSDDNNGADEAMVAVPEQRQDQHSVIVIGPPSHQDHQPPSPPPPAPPSPMRQEPHQPAQTAPSAQPAQAPQPAPSQPRKRKRSATELPPPETEDTRVTQRLRTFVMCAICLDTASAAVHCGQCSAIFCSACVQQLRGSSRRCRCPACRQPLHTTKSAHVRNIIDGFFPVACKHPGCGQLVPPSQLDAHHRACDHRPRPCPHAGCGLEMPRDQIEAHAAVCGFRLMPACAACGHRHRHSDGGDCIPAAEREHDARQRALAQARLLTPVAQPVAWRGSLTVVPEAGVAPLTLQLLAYSARNSRTPGLLCNFSRWGPELCAPRVTYRTLEQLRQACARTTFALLRPVDPSACDAYLRLVDLVSRRNAALCVTVGHSSALLCVAAVAGELWAATIQ